ncbi:MAG: hypothetical protein L3J09_01185 [Flavobacteriaceae bacterium]|nr:hypothetical protein [Flavobacteriaceae bacterium]
MLRKIITLLVLSITLVSCQFTETMTLNEDGSGRMTISMDLSEMMGMMGEMGKDSTMVKTDTIISFKEIFEEKKDSISKLSAEEKEKLKALENYSVHMNMDPETNKMIVDIFSDFKDVSESNDLMKAFEEMDDVMPNMGADDKKQDEEADDNNVAVRYSFKKGVFKRDAYIVDVEKHKTQVDSMASIESFMGAMTYKIKYTFPRKIKSASVEDALYSADGKTIEFERSFVDYIKNPDVLDLEVELEK